MNCTSLILFVSYMFCAWGFLLSLISVLILGEEVKYGEVEFTSFQGLLICFSALLGTAAYTHMGMCEAPFHWGRVWYLKLSSQTSDAKHMVKFGVSILHYVLHYSTKGSKTHEIVYPNTCFACIFVVVVVKHSAAGEKDKTGLILSILRQYLPVVTDLVMRKESCVLGIITMVISALLRFLPPVTIEGGNNFVG